MALEKKEQDYSDTLQINNLGRNPSLSRLLEAEEDDRSFTFHQETSEFFIARQNQIMNFATTQNEFSWLILSKDPDVATDDNSLFELESIGIAISGKEYERMVQENRANGTIKPGEIMLSAAQCLEINRIFECSGQTAASAVYDLPDIQPRPKNKEQIIMHIDPSVNMDERDQKEEPKKTKKSLPKSKLERAVVQHVRTLIQYDKVMTEYYGPDWKKTDFPETEYRLPFESFDEFRKLPSEERAKYGGGNYFNITTLSR